MNTTYPTTFAEIATWATSNRRPLAEARARFAQYVVLWAIAQSPHLSSAIVFKGGNALDFIWSSNRSTQDLDFSADMSRFRAESSQDLRALLIDALIPVERRFQVTVRVQRVEQQPPGTGRTFITYHCTIGYALQDDPSSRARIQREESVANVIPLEISLNEAIPGTANVSLNGTRPLRVSTPEDIVAEKLRALLQQQIRNRSRPQDLLDIAVILEDGPTLDISLIATYLIEKSASRNVSVTREAFHQAELANRARHGYEELTRTTRERFIAFDQALSLLLALVDQLDIPETDSFVDSS